MFKHQALQLLGGSVTSAASAIGISTQAISQWPNVLTKNNVDSVLAACLRKGIKVPQEFLVEQKPIKEASHP